MKYFSLDTDERGITVITFNRPPVNALSYDTYREIRELVETIQATDETRVAILTAAEGVRAWCGGADLNDLVPLDRQARLERYRLVNETLPTFYELDRPVIAAITKPAVGAGVVFASFCDIRVAADDTFFASPEIDRGVLAGGGTFYARLGMAQGLIREMTYTGRRVSAAEMKQAGFLNYCLPAAQVMPKARELAGLIAAKSLAALKETKKANNYAEDMGWRDAYKRTNATSADLTIRDDGREGVRAFLEGRSPAYSDS